MSTKILILSAILVFSGSSFADGNLNGNEIRDLFTDAIATVEVGSSQTAQWSFYRGGRLKLVGDNEQRESDWSVERRKLCYLKKNQKKVCRIVFDNGDGSYELRDRNNDNKNKIRKIVKMN